MSLRKQVAQDSLLALSLRLIILRPLAPTFATGETAVGTWRQYRADLFCGVSIRLLDEMRVNAKRRRGVRVAQAPAHGANWHSFRQQAGRGEVAQIMETH